MKKIQVKDFYWFNVPKMFREKFLYLMEQWDGSKSVYFAFYDMDVLENKLEEAKGY